MRLGDIMLTAAVTLCMPAQAQETGQASRGWRNGYARNAMRSKKNTRDPPTRMRLDSRLSRPRLV